MPWALKARPFRAFCTLIIIDYIFIAGWYFRMNLYCHLRNYLISVILGMHPNSFSKIADSNEFCWQAGFEWQVPVPLTVRAACLCKITTRTTDKNGNEHFPFLIHFPCSFAPESTNRIGSAKSVRIRKIEPLSKLQVSTVLNFICINRAERYWFWV